MATREESSTVASAGPTPEENRAKAAFEAYKKRMEAFSASMGGHPGQPVPPPYMHAMPGWTFPPPPTMMPQPPVPPHSAPGYVDTRRGRSGSLFEGIGNMIRLGVDAVNLGLAGGIQIMEGLAGQGGHGWDPGWQGPPCYYPHYPSYGHHGYHDCYCDPCYVHYGCNPSVNNC